MFNLRFSYSFKLEGDIFIIKVTGFTTYNNVVPAMERIVEEIKNMDNSGKPYKLLFDLRGFKALEPRSIEAIKAIDEVVYKSSAIKVGTVLDSMIAKLQHMRTAGEYRMPNAELFGDYEACLRWLKE